MAMVNMNNLLNGKDSRWLQLEVCREFQRNKCSRPDTECKFAHPPANVEVQNGRVTACYDSIKVRNLELVANAASTRIFFIRGVISRFIPGSVGNIEIIILPTMTLPNNTCQRQLYFRGNLIYR